MVRLSKAPLRRFFLTCILVVLLIASYGVLPPQIEAAPNPFESDDTAASRALGLVNEWRVSEGLMPLELNGVLQQMAQAQAEYILPRLSSISEEELYHHDAKGRTAIARAVEVYNWPDFNLPQRVEVGENAAQFNVKGAVNFWQNSPIHKKTATNPTYREVGIVALPLPAKGTYLFYMCFGARPNKLTAMLAPEGDTLYVSREFSKYSPEKKVEPTIQLFDANRTPLTDPMPYSLKVSVPKGAGAKFYVKYKTSKSELWTEVQNTRDNTILSDKPAVSVSAQLKAVLAEEKVDDQQATQTALAITPFDPVNVSPTSSATLAPASTRPQVTLPPTNTHAPTAMATSTQAAVAQQVTLPPTNTHIPTATTTATPQTISLAATTQPASPTQQSVGQPDLIISYSSKALFVQNVSKRSLKLDGLKIGRLSIDAWQSVVKLPANGLPAGNCLEADVVGAGEEAPPGVCKHVWVAIQVNPSRAFWTTDAFDVIFNGSVIRTCALAAKTCDIKLP